MFIVLFQDLLIFHVIFLNRLRFLYKIFFMILYTRIRLADSLAEKHKFLHTGFGAPESSVIIFHRSQLYAMFARVSTNIFWYMCGSKWPKYPCLWSFGSFWHLRTFLPTQGDIFDYLPCPLKFSKVGTLLNFLSLLWTTGMTLKINCINLCYLHCGQPQSEALISLALQK